MRWPERGHLLGENFLSESGGEHPREAGLGALTAGVPVGPPLSGSLGANSCAPVPQVFATSTSWASAR